MNEIDFLPQRYREQVFRRKKQFWNVVVVLCYAALLCSAAYLQRTQHRGLDAELTVARQQHAAVSAQEAQLNQLKSELAALQSEAELITFLRTPWPRTRVLVGIIKQLPDSLTLTELSIGATAAGATASLPALRDTPTTLTSATDTPTDTRSPAEQDLADLQQALESAPTQIHLKGLCHDNAALHAYLSQLNANPLFVQVQLLSIERHESGDGTSLFAVRITLAPAANRSSLTTTAETGHTLAR